MIPPSAPRKALVIKLGHIGDVLVTTPVMRALKDAYAGLHLTALVNQGTEAMLTHGGLADQVLVLRRDQASLWQTGLRQARLLASLLTGGFDLALDLSGGDRGAFLALCSRASLRVGFAPKKPHLRTRAFHLLVDQRGTRNHVVETFLRQPRALGLEFASGRLEFSPGEQARAQAAALLDQHGLEPGGYALVHPTSRWMFKSWTPQGMAALLEHLAGRGLPVVLTSGPDLAELRHVAAIKGHLSPGLPLVDLCGRLDLYLLGAMLEQARLFVGVDSAPMHMAAALGVPVVVLFGPSGEAMWGPWQVACQVVAKDWDCRPCGRDGCHGSKVSRCLEELSPQEVLAAVDRLLEGIPCG